MIVPRGRLLWVVAAVCLPAAIVGAISGPLALAMLGLLAVFILLLAVDAAMGKRRLHGVHVTLPPLVRLSEQRAADMTVGITWPTRQIGCVRIGLVLPEEGLHSADEDRLVDLPSDSDRAELPWQLEGTRRGRYDLTEVRLEAASPLGLWSARTAQAVTCEVRVYPNLLLERESVAPLLLRRGSTGMHTQRQLGKGREFEKLREYAAGDSFEDIHWKATARRGVPITKVFQVERTQEIYVVLDASRLSARRVDEQTTVLERFVTAALIMGLAAEQQGDLFGLVAFSDKVQRFVRAKNGSAHFGACRDALYSLQSEETTPDFEELCTFLRLRLRRRALLIFLTELDDPLLSESFTEQIRHLSRHHLVLANMLQPKEAKPLFTGAEPETVDAIYDQLGGHLAWRRLKELESTLRSSGVRFSLLDSVRIGAQLTALYHEVKQRQLL